MLAIGRGIRVVVSLSAALVLAGGALPASAAADDDATELREGHMDVGPVLADGSWEIQVKDDSGDETVWRDAEDVAFRVSDAAEHELPDDEAYAFLGEPGDDVFLIPQTQVSGVVWLGWNTQHESVLEAEPTDISFELSDIEGPGEVHVYFDYGGFRDPKQLWSTDAEPEPVGVEVNAHAHANWAFSEAGEYTMTFAATLTDAEGTVQEASAELRFLVGDDTRASAPAGDRSVRTILLVGTGGLLVIVIVVAVVLVRRSRRRRRAARSE